METFLNYFLGFTRFRKDNTYSNALATYPNPANKPSASPASRKYRVAKPAKTAKPDHLIRRELPDQ
jgi:hypothetical protein